jgi:hypothetical protein
MASQSLGFMDIAWTALRNLHKNLCSGVQFSLQPQYFPGSLGLKDGGFWFG